MPKRKPMLILTPAAIARAQELTRRALGDAAAFDWRRTARSYLQVRPELRTTALAHDPFAAHPDLGFALVDLGRALLKHSTAEARSFAGLAGQVAATLLGRDCGPGASGAVVRRLSCDLASAAAALQAEARLVDGERTSARPWLKVATAYLRQGTGDPYLAASLHQVQALLCWVEGEPRRALALLKKAARIAESIGDHCSAALAHLRQGEICRAGGDQSGARLAFDRAARLLPHLGPEDAARFRALLAEVAGGPLPAEPGCDARPS